jgi:hypothetical protein
METSRGASKASRTLFPCMPTTINSMFGPITIRSPRFRLKTNMAFTSRAGLNQCSGGCRPIYLNDRFRGFVSLGFIADSEQDSLNRLPHAGVVLDSDALQFPSGIGVPNFRPTGKWFSEQSTMGKIGAAKGPPLTRPLEQAQLPFGAGGQTFRHR